MLELNEISDKQTLLRLMSDFYSGAAQHQDTPMQIIDAVHSHMLTAERTARLLGTWMLEPFDLPAKLQAEKAAFNATELRKAEIDSLFMKMYEDWSAGRITEYSFNMLSVEHQAQPYSLDAKIQQPLDGQKQPLVVSSSHTGDQA